MTFTITAATSSEHARELLASATPPNSSFTQQSNFSVERIDRALRIGSRRASWVWFASDDNGRTLGVVAGWGAAARTVPDVLDFFDLPTDPEVAGALLDRATADSTTRRRTTLELLLYLPTEMTLDDPSLAGQIEILAASGFRMLVRRHRYRLPVRTTVVSIPETQLEFRQVDGPDDPRLVSVMREILVGSLDAHDLAALERADIDTVAQETVDEYLGLDPVDSFFLASDRAGEIVGLVIGGLRGSPEIGTASFIGVSHRHRGHGYAGQLLGWMTGRLIDAGAQFIIGETDDDNFPMDRAFTSVGYPHTESRIDFVRELGSSGADAAGRVQHKPRDPR